MKVKIKKTVKWAISPREIKTFNENEIADVSGSIGQSMIRNGFGEEITGAKKVEEPKKETEKPKKGKKRNSEAQENKRLDDSEENK